MPKQRLLSLTRDDFTWQYFRAGGNGGQKQNKSSTGVRCIHPPSGASAEARDGRSQWQNRQAAFRRCVNSDAFRSWLKRRSSGAVADLAELERQVERAVERDMAPENLRTEVWNGKEWVVSG